MIPNARKMKNTPLDFALLMDQIGRPQLWVAERVGISRRRLQYLAVGERLIDGKMQAVLMTYPEQFTLESLAEAAIGLD